MHQLTEIPAWERLMKRMVWEQMDFPKGEKILDFGSGEGITANHFAGENRVTAVEPWEEMLKNRWQDYPYEQIAGDLSALRQFPDGCFDKVICHNVLEYIDDKEAVIRELARVLKPGGEMSVMKHNRYGRVMQTAVLLDDVDKANELLDRKNSMASKFGAIRYYEDEDIPRWEPSLCIEKVYGIRTFWDLQQNQEKHGDEDWQKRMKQLEMRVAEMDAFRRIAFFHHLILKKR